MEEQQDRVLAYVLARPVEIDQTALDNIAGGGQGPIGQMCSRECIRATGAGGLANMDVVGDVTVDW